MIVCSSLSLCIKRMSIFFNTQKKRRVILGYLRGYARETRIARSLKPRPRHRLLGHTGFWEWRCQPALLPGLGDEPGPLQNGLGTTHCWDTGHPFDAIIGLWEFFPFLTLASVLWVPRVFSVSIWDHSCCVPQLSELPSHRQHPTPASSFQICSPTCRQAQDIPFTEDKTLDLLLEFWLGNICCQSVKHSSRGYGGVSRFSLLWLTLRHSENLSTVRWPATSFPRGTRWQCVKSFY